MLRRRVEVSSRGQSHSATQPQGLLQLLALLLVDISRAAGEDEPALHEALLPEHLLEPLQKGGQHLVALQHQGEDQQPLIQHFLGLS